MARPDDIAASLPQPPPPSPSRRDAAIRLANTFFDAGDRPTPVKAQRGTGRGSPWWRIANRPQAAALVTITLVAIIGIPAAWMSLNDPPRSIGEPGPGIDAPGNSPDGNMKAGPVVPGVVPSISVDRPALPSTQTAKAEAEQPPPPPPPPSAAEAAFVDTAVVAAQAPAGPAMRPRVSARDSEDRQIVVTGTNVRGVPPTGSNAISMDREDIKATGATSSAELASNVPQAGGQFSEKSAEPRKEADDRSVVVTGAAKRSATGRGDWNACTVNDPARNLRACRSLIGSNARGAGGRAAAQVSDGLRHAWDGDSEAAIAAFDRAIAEAPRSAFAYLNRGLANQRAGNLNRAIADLDQAVRLDPNSARGYYVRGQMLRAQGNVRRARADEQRAVELDWRYADVVD